MPIPGCQKVVQNEPGLKAINGKERSRRWSRIVTFLRWLWSRGSRITQVVLYPRVLPCPMYTPPYTAYTTLPCVHPPYTARCTCSTSVHAGVHGEREDSSGLRRLGKPGWSLPEKPGGQELSRFLGRFCPREDSGKDGERIKIG